MMWFCGWESGVDPSGKFIAIAKGPPTYNEMMRDSNMNIIRTLGEHRAGRFFR
jgi:hypothetical protein